MIWPFLRRSPAIHTVAGLGAIQAHFKVEHAGFSLDVELNLPGRGVSALFGDSGSGKTSCLRCFAGLDQPAEGYLQVNGELWQDSAQGIFVPAHQRAVGYVFQEANLFAHLSVHGNLQYGLKRIPAAQRRIALEQAVELLGIGHLLQRLPGKLSGGEQQRVGIARALLTSPRLLLLDEPLASLDLKRKQEVLPYLERLHEELHIPIVYVSHALDEVARLADHLVLMEAGRARAEGPLAETLARLDLPVALGEHAGVVLDGVVGERDPRWQLARLDVDGEACRLWARDQGLAIGRRVRVRVLARDVSLTRTPQTGTSIGNQVRCTIEAIAGDEHPALALVRVRAGKAPLVARVTRRSAHALELAAGMAVWAQVKTVALME
jgi:molybdate transport system ATP-binding protein